MSLELAPCEVHGEGGELVAAGHVRSADASSLQVSAPRYSGHVLEPGDVVVLEVASAVRGECTFDAVVSASRPGFIDLAQLQLRDVRQRRTAVRVPIMMAFTFDAVVQDGEDVPFEPPLAALVLDVSADGMRFRTDVPLPVGTQLRAEFPARRTVPLLVEVLRHEDLRGGIAHGCRFVGITERDRDLLIQYVLQEERRILVERRDALTG